MVPTQRLLTEVSGQAEAVFQQILQHQMEGLVSGACGDSGHHFKSVARQRSAARQLIVLQIPGFRDQRRQGTAGAAKEPRIARAGAACAGTRTEVKTARVADADRRSLKLGGVLAECRSKQGGSKSQGAKNWSHDG